VCRGLSITNLNKIVNKTGSNSVICIHLYVNVVSWRHYRLITFPNNYNTFNKLINNIFLLDSFNSSIHINIYVQGATGYCPFTPKVFIDVTSTLKCKLQLKGCAKHPFLHSLEFLRQTWFRHRE
jgi:hypothetical protein